MFTIKGFWGFGVLGFWGNCRAMIALIPGRGCVSWYSYWLAPTTSWLDWFHSCSWAFQTYVSLSLSPTFWAISTSIATVLDGVLLAGLALYILGRDRRNSERIALRLPELRIALVGLVMPVAISGLFPTAQYLVDRIHWAAYDFGRFGPPELFTYFNLASWWQPLLFFIVFVGLAEEIVFRGLLLPCFIDRYGLQRGIFLTGLIWAAFHFRSDSYSGLSVGGVLFHLARGSSCSAWR